MPDQEICGITRMDGTGREWVCINPPHDKVYRRKSGKPVFASGGRYVPPGEKHYFVRKYPNEEGHG